MTVDLTRRGSDVFCVTRAVLLSTSAADEDDWVIERDGHFAGRIYRGAVSRLATYRQRFLTASGAVGPLPRRSIARFDRKRRTRLEQIA